MNAKKPYGWWLKSGDLSLEVGTISPSFVGFFMFFQGGWDWDFWTITSNMGLMTIPWKLWKQWELVVSASQTLESCLTLRACAAATVVNTWKVRVGESRVGCGKKRSFWWKSDEMSFKFILRFCGKYVHVYYIYTFIHAWFFQIPDQVRKGKG